MSDIHNGIQSFADLLGHVLVTILIAETPPPPCLPIKATGGRKGFLGLPVPGDPVHHSGESQWQGAGHMTVTK